MYMALPDVNDTSERVVGEEDYSDISTARDYYSAIYGIRDNLLSEDTITVNV
jgi:hypothetical protein